MDDKTLELANDFDKKDLRFRRAKGVFFGLLSAAVITLLILSYLQQASNNKILDKLAGYAAQRTSQIKELQNHIDCIATFLGQEHRTNLTITDLSSCGLKRAGDGQLELINPPTPISGDSDQNSTSPTINQQPTAPVPAPAQSPQQDSTPAPNPPAPQPEPVKVLGLSVCVPFTHVCITR